MRTMFSDTPRTALTLAYWGFVLYLFLPLTLMMAMSFKDADFVAFPIGDWTFDWYLKVMQDKQFLEACAYSIFVAAMTTLAATVIGVWIAMLIASTEGRWGAVVCSRWPACRPSCLA